MFSTGSGKSVALLRQENLVVQTHLEEDAVFHITAHTPFPSLSWPCGLAPCGTVPSPQPHTGNGPCSYCLKEYIFASF